MEMKPYCAGCGRRIPDYSIVGIKIEDGVATASPVCKECWEDPAHRKVPLKMHFFQKGMTAQALSLAGSSSLGV